MDSLFNSILRHNGTVATIAVIVMSDGGLVQIETYPNTPEGKEKAQAMFKGQVKDANKEVTDEQLALHLKDGFYSYGFITVCIVNT